MCPPDLFNPLQQLELPRRWETLTQRAEAAGIDAIQCIERVDAAANRIDALLQRVRTGGGGLFEVVFGLSGSGKTTFLKTLPKFFQDLTTHSFSRETALVELAHFVRSTAVGDLSKPRVILIERRDNPSPGDLEQVDQMLTDLLDVFRTPEGRVLVLWPITRLEHAELIARKAWKTGRDSMVESSTRGIFRFEGLPKERYYEVADLTSRSLGGDSLEAFGVSQQVALELLPPCETISDFYAAVDVKADEQRTQAWSILKERVRLHLWVVLPGDKNEALRSTEAALTQGTRSRIDVDKVGEFIDLPSNEALYVRSWRNRRGALAHLLRTVDVRLFALPPNVALAAVRAFGDDATKKVLKQASVNLEKAKNAMKSSRLYKAILLEAGIETTPFQASGNIATETEHEYRRVQALAARNDHKLNKALGSLIEACLADDAPHLRVIAEKQSIPSSQLQPDVQISLGERDFICLEPTWRSTDAGIPNELEGGQNTLTEAHIKKYMLEKADQYVKDLGLLGQYSA